MVDPPVDHQLFTWLFHLVFLQAMLQHRGVLSFSSRIKTYTVPYLGGWTSIRPLGLFWCSLRYHGCLTPMPQRSMRHGNGMDPNGETITSMVFQSWNHCNSIFKSMCVHVCNDVHAFVILYDLSNGFMNWIRSLMSWCQDGDSQSVCMSGAPEDQREGLRGKGWQVDACSTSWEKSRTCRCYQIPSGNLIIFWYIAIEHGPVIFSHAKLPTIWTDGNGTARKKLGRGES